MSAEESFSFIKLLTYLIGVGVVWLIFKKTMRLLFPLMLNFMMNKVHSSLQIKKKLFDEAFENVSTNNKSSKLEILEIGIGTGCNFKHFPKDANVTILDKDDQFLSYLRASMERENRQDLQISKLVVNTGENMKDIKSNSMDAVVHTFIMCSVSDYSLVMQEIHRVLKPGGVCIFIEHSIDEKNFLRRLIQLTIQSLGLFQECKFLPMRKVLESSKCETVILKDYKLNGLAFNCMNPLVYGYSKKSL